MKFKFSLYSFILFSQLFSLSQVAQAAGEREVYQEALGRLRGVYDHVNSRQPDKKLAAALDYDETARIAREKGFLGTYAEALTPSAVTDLLRSTGPASNDLAFRFLLD